MITIVEASGLPSGSNFSLMRQALTEKGQGQFRKFGFHIYDAKFLAHKAAVKTAAVTPPYALQLTYFMNIKAQKIVDASIEQMNRQKQNRAFLSKWRQALTDIIPAVTKGDTLTVFHDTNRAIFYLNGSYLGEINDSDFAHAFFGIWLDKNTSAPTLRKKLLQLH